MSFSLLIERGLGRPA